MFELCGENVENPSRAYETEYIQYFPSLVDFEIRSIQASCEEPVAIKGLFLQGSA